MENVDSKLRKVCREGNAESALQLISEGANPGWGLYEACKAGHVELANKIDADPRWGLEGACEGNHNELIEQMLAKGGDPNWGARGAARGGNWDILNKFLTVRPNSNIRMPKVIEGACEGKQFSMIEQVISMPTFKHIDYYDSFIYVCEHGDEDIVRKFIGYRLNSLYDGAEAAARSNSEKVTRMIINAAKPDTREMVIVSAIDGAYQGGKFEFADRLEKELKTEKYHRESRFLSLCVGNHTNEVLKMLNTSSSYDQMLLYAAKHNNRRLIAVAFENDADPNYGLRGACQSANIPLIKEMLKRGANPSKSLWVSAEHNFREVAKLLLDEGADPSDYFTRMLIFQHRSKEVMAELIPCVKDPGVILATAKKREFHDWIDLITPHIKSFKESS